MIIDKNYPSIIDCGGYFKINCDLVFVESIKIEVSLLVVGDIYSEGNISSKGDIYSKGNISSKGDISSEGDIYSKGDIFMMGIKTTHIMIINSNIGYKIWVMDTHIKIGCKFYSKDEWLRFNESNIKDMDSRALKIWNNNKELLIALCTLWNHKNK
ncbi:MAG: hypothetical protein ACYDEI_00235 [Erysipelotrichaceae bacterium]